MTIKIKNIFEDYFYKIKAPRLGMGAKCFLDTGQFDGSYF